MTMVHYMKEISRMKKEMDLAGIYVNIHVLLGGGRMANSMVILGFLMNQKTT